MKMFSHALGVFVGWLAVVSARETIRPLPTITNSLVNLGKMDISFYFNGNDPAHRTPDHGPVTPAAPVPYFPRNEPFIEEPCPCSNMRNAKESFLTNPTGLINKIISNNDLFSFNKDPLSSTLCCDSHEHIAQEGTIILELPPKPVKPAPISRSSNPLPMMPFLFDSIIPNKSMLPPLKTKAIEIFLFPKKKDLSNVINTFEMAKFPKKKDIVPKEGITIVGDKKLENNIDLFKPPPPSPVKKDLSAKEMTTAKVVEVEKPADDVEKIIIEPANKPNTV
ncbi:uncharacterized protein LOC118263956 isoform X1 [Spodoptera frugiperda]|uniref:Uncharacterized protein LOC118263956 isoform X1 n=1 Tax=Spodoptera frugiperda TaxID=7108 RepID=A0A9R0EGR9_SPOFR|nr:uncharacterized protein LOC118263956 isoform X1 [Spodoptera frugiperda]